MKYFSQARSSCRIHRSGSLSFWFVTESLSFIGFSLLLTILVTKVWNLLYFHHCTKKFHYLILGNLYTQIIYKWKDFLEKIERVALRSFLDELKERPENGHSFTSRKAMQLDKKASDIIFDHGTSHAECSTTQWDQFIFRVSFRYLFKRLWEDKIAWGAHQVSTLSKRGRLYSVHVIAPWQNTKMLPICFWNLLLIYKRIVTKFSS